MKYVQTPEDHVIVVFGANGDLARRKLLPAFYHLAEAGLMPRRYVIIGNSRSEVTDEEFRAFARTAVDEFCRCQPSDEVWSDFSARLRYVSHEFQPEETHPLDAAVRKAEEELGEVRRLFYLAVPPSAFATITEGLAACGLTKRACVVYEKPFGADVDSFRELNRVVEQSLDETQVYRIDHFLGKETLQNILALRFANGMFEPVWNRNHIDHVQIDVPEELEIGTRAGFYDTTGALKDMVVTHLFQTLSVIAMEPPVALTPKPLIDEKVKIFESMVPLQPEEVIRGQYEGYRAVEGVAENSDTETFIAASVSVENWRWAGVPFFLRTGKALAASRQIVSLGFREPPLQLFGDLPIEGPARNFLTIDLGHHEGITMSFLAKVPGPTVELGPARMEFSYEDEFLPRLVEAYERLLHDALIGDRTLFTRPDGIERAWELVAPVLADPPPLHVYPQGSWGPSEAERLIEPRSWKLPDRESCLD